MTVYTYVVNDLLSQRPLGRLPLTNVSFGNVLNGAGELKAELLLNPELTRSELTAQINATTEARTALYVLRDGVCVWGGIIWTSNYSSNSQTISINGSEFWSYFQHRYFRDTISWVNRDTLQIVQEAIAYAQSKAGGDIGVILNGETSTVLDTLEVKGEESPEIASSLESLANKDNAFDFAIDVSAVGDGFVKNLNLSAPRRGRTAPNSELLLSYPGNIVDWRMDRDGTKRPNSGRSVGAGEGIDMIQDDYARSDLLDEGWPLLETTTARKEITDLAVLAQMQKAEIDAAANGTNIVSLTIRADAEPVIGSYITGDDCRVKINDRLRLPSGIDFYARITAINVSDVDNELVQLTLDAKEFNTPPFVEDTPTPGIPDPTYDGYAGGYAGGY